MNKNTSTDGIVAGGGWGIDHNEMVEDLIEVKIYGYKVYLFWSIVSTCITGALAYYLWFCKVPNLSLFFIAIGLIYFPLQVYYIRMIIKRFGQKTRVVKELGQRPKQNNENLY